jgi:hypothetical protein
MGGIALMWRGGCIIRSRFLGKIKEAFDKNPDLDNLLLDSFFSALNKYQARGARPVHRAIELGVPTPAFSTALAFFDGYRTARLPANLLQAQRDFFGAHTYERVDQPRGQFFHTNWTGRGGRVSSTTYNADGFGDAANGQRAVHRPRVAGTPNATALIGRCRECLHIEEICTTQIVVALRILRADRRSVDRDVDSAVGKVRCHSNRARNLVESAPHHANHVVPGAEVDKTVVMVNLVIARSW